MIDRMKVEALKRAMMRGEPIPSPVLRLKQNGRYEVLDGNETIEALHELGIDNVEGAIVVNCDAAKAAELREAFKERDKPKDGQHRTWS
jgi:hypothetical protein